MNLTDIFFEAFCGLTPLEEQILEPEKKAKQKEGNNLQEQLLQAFFPDESPVRRENISPLHKRSLD